MCESVLQTYVSFHHMLLALKDPSLSAKVDGVLDNLLSSPEKVRIGNFFHRFKGLKNRNASIIASVMHFQQKMGKYQGKIC